MKRFSALILLVVVTAFPPDVVRGQEEDEGLLGGSPVEIIAAGESRIEDGIAIAVDDVRIKYEDVEIYADEGRYNPRTKDVYVRGNVTIYRGGMIYMGEGAVYNLETGRMSANSLKSGFMDVLYDTGEFLTEDPEELLHAEGAIFTTHDSSNPNYKIKAKEIDIYPYDKIVFRNLTIYAGKVPVMWLPYLAQPFDEDLGYHFLPGWYSDWGAFLLNSYGVMLGDTTLAKFQLDLRSDRGIAGGIELLSMRHRDLGNENFGRLYVYGALDSDPNMNNPSTLPEDQISDSRYRINLQHRIYLPGPDESTLYIDFDINKLSDALFYRDFFPAEFQVDPKPDNVINAVKYHERGTASLLTRLRLNDFYYTDERLPEFALDFTRQQVFNTGLFYSGETTIGQYKGRLSEQEKRYLQRDIEDLENPDKKRDPVTGKLVQIPPELDPDTGLPLEVDEAATELVVDPETGELIERETLLGALEDQLAEPEFNRFDTYHEFNYPTRAFGWLNLNPRVGVRATYYNGVSGLTSGSETRALVHAGLDASMKFSKVYPNVRNHTLGLDGVRHIVQPYINYSLIAGNNLSENFLGIDANTPNPKLRAIDFPQFTAIDSIRNWNIMRLGLMNRLQTRRDNYADGSARTHNWFTWNMFLDVFFEDPEFNRTISNFNNLISWTPLQWLRLTNETQFPTADEFDYTEVNTNLSWMPARWTEFSIGHRYLNNHPYFDNSNQMTLSNYTRLGDNWGFSFFHRWELESSTLQVQQYKIHRDLQSWVASVGAIIRDNGENGDEYGVVLSMTLKAFPQMNIPLNIDPSNYGGQSN